MTDGRSEGHEPTPETPQTGADASIPETPRAVSSPRRTGCASRERRLQDGSPSLSSKAWPIVLSIGLLIYLTYFFTMFFSTRPPAPAPVPESARVAAKKIEELRAEERQLLTTYGPVNPVTKTVRIPIDRAMDLIVAEGGRPAPAPAARPDPRVGGGDPESRSGDARPRKPEAAATTTPKAGAATAAFRSRLPLGRPGARAGPGRNGPGPVVPCDLHCVPRRGRAGHDRPQGHALDS